jgi:predicted amidohydrolase
VEKGCRLAVFPESMLYSAMDEKKAEIGAQIERIRQAASEIGIYMIFGLSYRDSDDVVSHNQALVIDPSGGIVHKYKRYGTSTQTCRGFIPCL